MGYACPERQTTADFLTSLTNPSERTAKSGFEAKVPKTPDQFAKAWKESALRQDLVSSIASFESRYPLDGDHTDKFMATRRAHQASWM